MSAAWLARMNGVLEAASATKAAQAAAKEEESDHVALKILSFACKTGELNSLCTIDNTSSVSPEVSNRVPSSPVSRADA